LTLFEAAAASRGTGITYLSDSVEIFETYTELLGAARHHLGGLRKIGMEQGEPCLMQIGQLRVHIHAMWGCILGGIILVNVSIPSKYEVKSAVVQKLLGVLDNLDAKHVLASSDNAASLRRLLPQTSEGANTTVHDVSQLDVSSPAVCEPMIRAGDVLFYLLTSGSTGRSKCIPECHRAIVSHLRHSILHCNYKPSDVAMNWLPFDHVVPMLTYHLCDVYLARHSVQVPTAEIIADPLLWVRTLGHCKCTHSWSPNFGCKLVVTALEADPTCIGSLADLSSIKRLMNAGEQVTTAVCDSFLSMLHLHPSVMQPAFGMAEVCTCMTYNNKYDQSKAFINAKDSIVSNRLRLVDNTGVPAE